MPTGRHSRCAWSRILPRTVKTPNSSLRDTKSAASTPGSGILARLATRPSTHCATPGTKTPPQRAADPRAVSDTPCRPDAWAEPAPGHSDDNGPAPVATAAPVGGSPIAVQNWFDTMAAAAKPENDGNLTAAPSPTAAHDSARSLSQPHHSQQHKGGLPLGGARLVRPARGPSHAHRPRDVAMFLATDRNRGQAGNPLKPRAAAIRLLYRGSRAPG